MNRNLSANHRSTDMSKGGVANTPVPAKQEQVTVKEEGEIADSQEYACEQCEKKFDRKSCLSNHMKVHQSSAEKASARKKAPKRRKESTPTKSVSAKRKMGEPSKPVETVGPSEIAPAYISSVSLFDFVKGAPVPILEPDASDAQNENASAGPLTTTAEEQPAVEHPPSFAFPAMPAPVDSEIAGDEDLKMGDDEKTPPLDDDLAYLIDPDL